MTRPFDKHLDSDELDRLVSLPETSVSGSEQLSEPALREAQRHVESCQDCSRKVQRHKFVQSEILRMRVPKPSPPTPECIGDAEWLKVAAGLAAGSEDKRTDETRGTMRALRTSPKERRRDASRTKQLRARRPCWRHYKVRAPSGRPKWPRP